MINKLLNLMLQFIAFLYARIPEASIKIKLTMLIDPNNLE
jgi:hypothetical protein